jgi:hypothetical protein
VPISRNKDSLWEIWNKVYTHCKLKETQGNVKSEMETMLKVESSKAIVAQLTRTILQYTIKILGVLSIKQKNYYCHFLWSYHI